jgi:hypothetical protein
MARLVGPILTATGERKPEWFTAAKRAKRLLPSCEGGSQWEVNEAGSGKVDESGSGSPAAAGPDADCRGFAPRPMPPARGGEIPAPSSKFMCRSGQTECLRCRSAFGRVDHPHISKSRGSRSLRTCVHFVTIS